jgi:hypothetical protein
MVLPRQGDGPILAKFAPDLKFFFQSIGILTDNNISDEIVWPEYPQHAVFQPLKF